METIIIATGAALSSFLTDTPRRANQTQSGPHLAAFRCSLMRQTCRDGIGSGSARTISSRFAIALGSSSVCCDGPEVLTSQ